MTESRPSPAASDNFQKTASGARVSAAEKENDLVKLGRPALVMGFILLAAPNARAQMQWTDKLFVNVNGGYQAASGGGEFTSTSEFELYEETATLTTTQELKGGGVFDISAGYRAWKNVAVALGITYTSSSSDVLVNALLPHPIAYDQFRTATATAPDAKHSELQTHLQLVWFWPYSDKIDFAFSAGPSFISTGQELVSAVTIAPEPGPDYSNPQISDVTVNKQSKTAFGVNLGADMTYRITKNYGAGVTLRYVHGSVNLPGLTDSMSVGGFQILGGFRFRY
jgi:hypothetical protein